MVGPEPIVPDDFSAHALGHTRNENVDTPTEPVHLRIHRRRVAKHFRSYSPTRTISIRNFVNAVMQENKQFPPVNVGGIDNVGRVDPNIVVTHVADTFGQHGANVMGPDVGLNVQQDVANKSFKSRIPLIRKVAVATDMAPMRMEIPHAIVRVDHGSFAVLAEHRLQLRGALLFAGPVENESLYSHWGFSGRIVLQDPVVDSLRVPQTTVDQDGFEMAIGACSTEISVFTDRAEGFRLVINSKLNSA